MHAIIQATKHAFTRMKGKLHLAETQLCTERHYKNLCGTATSISPKQNREITQMAIGTDWQNDIYKTALKINYCHM